MQTPEVVRPLVVWRSNVRASAAASAGRFLKQPVSWRAWHAKWRAKRTAASPPYASWLGAVAPLFALQLSVVLLERDPRVLPSSCFGSRLRFPRQLLRHFEIHSIQGPGELWPHSIRGGTFHSSLLPLSPAAECPLCLRTQFICGYDKNRIGDGIGNIDHFQIPPLPSLSGGNSRIIPSTDILQRPAENILNFLLGDFVFIDVRLSRR